MIYEKNPVKQYLLSLIDFSNIKTVLDIGCGYGSDLFEIGERVSEDAVLVGIDSIQKAIIGAKANLKADKRFLFKHENVEEGLSFDGNTFDLVYSCNTLECINDKTNLIKDIYRVLNPNGQVLFSHYDWDTQVFNLNNKKLYRKILHTFNDWQQPWMSACDPWMGRKLNGLFKKSGLFEGEVSVFVLTETEYKKGYKGYYAINEEFSALVDKGLIDKDDYEELKKEIEESADKGEYFYSINMYIYKGEKNSF